MDWILNKRKTNLRYKHLKAHWNWNVENLLSRSTHEQRQNKVRECQENIRKEQPITIKTLKALIFINIDKAAGTGGLLQNKTQGGRNVISQLHSFIWNYKISGKRKTNLFHIIVESFLTNESEIWMMTEKKKLVLW